MVPNLVAREFRRLLKHFLGELFDVDGSQPVVGRVPAKSEPDLPVAAGFSDRGDYPSQASEKPPAGHLVGSLATGGPGGFFPGGTGFNFYKPVMKEVHKYHGLGMLHEMVKYIIPGAVFDSSYRDDPPRCHPDTRTEILDQLQACVHDTSWSTKIVWLVGPAGVGKSAIMQSLAEIVCECPTFICATLFFSRPNHRDDPKKAFTTLAYSFSIADPEYRRYMAEQLAIDPLFFDKSLDEQFKRLFVTPFRTKGVYTGFRRWVVFIDGLDECSGEKEQSRIVDLIRESLLYHTQTSPFIWVIASRPEVHLQATFRQVREQIASFWELEVPVNSEESLRSVEFYFRSEFAKIQRNYADVVPSVWPSENSFLRLIQASSGLFIFASTLVKYINKEDPVLRLQHALSKIGRGTAGQVGRVHRMRANPFDDLDALYMTIMSGLSSDSLSSTKTILASYLLGDLVLIRNWNLLQICNILGLEQHETYAALRRLHSVLTFPSPSDAYERPIQFLHNSFPDFLTNRSRSQSYHIDLDQELGNIWRCYVNILKMGGQLTLSWEPPTTKQESDVCVTIAKDARFQWLRILTRFCHDPSCQHGMERHLSLDTSELVEVFEKLAPIFFECMKFHVGFFCGWLSNHAPVAFRQAMIYKELDLTELTEKDLDNMFTGLCGRKWGCWIYSPAWATFDLSDLNTDRWNEAKRRVLSYPNDISWGERGRPVKWLVLANLLKPQETLEMTRPRGVLIIRLGPAEYYAIIGPLALRACRAGRKINYLVFPYHVASSNSPSPPVATPHNLVVGQHIE